MRERIKQELSLLRCHYGDDVEYLEKDGDWFHIPRYSMPSSCSPLIAPVCFSLKPGYPGVEPYGFFIASTVSFNGAKFPGGSAPSPPPFTGQWIFLSWSPDGWIATADVVTGANLWAWARSFAARLREGL